MWLDSVYIPEDKYILARYLYGQSMETMEEISFNQLDRYIRVNDLLPEYTTRSWSSDPVPLELLKKYNKESLIREIVLTDKTESIPSLGSYNEIHQELYYKFRPGYLSRKMDGWNLQNTYQKIYIITNTRGRSSDAIMIPSLGETLPAEIQEEDMTIIVGEGTLSEKNLEILKKRLGRPDLTSTRAAIRTLIANPQHMDLLYFTAFAIKGVVDPKETMQKLTSWGFNTPNWMRIETYDQLLEGIKVFSDKEPLEEQPTDGLVYMSEDGGYLRAIRVEYWEEKVYESYVIDYIESYNAHVISQSVKISPILLDGKTQRQVNITNWDRIIQYNLEIGAPIAFIIKSDSTADIEPTRTMELQAEYRNNFELYQKKIDIRENRKILKK